MEQLDLLWNLELHHNSLNTYQKQLLRLKDDLMLKDTEKKLESTEIKLSRFKTNHDQIKFKLKESDRRLKDYNYKIEEVEKNLYNGETTDIKQLEYLSREKDRLKEIINDAEIEVLELMDEVEDTDKELGMMEVALHEMKEKNMSLKIKYKTIKKEMEDKIQFEEDEIIALEGKIDKDLLYKYYLIKKSKGTGIAKINSSVCSGCNMHIPTFLIDKLNNEDTIIYCESCGRILCK